VGGTGSKPEPSNYGYCDGGCWHPHVHALVCRGGWTRDWGWVPVPYVDEHAPSARADRDHSPDARVLRRSWAQLIKRVYEVDPLVCPKCQGEMRIVAFIIDHDVVGAILRHLAKVEARSPRGPPGTAALSAAS
jgi:hypothetical protein